MLSPLPPYNLKRAFLRKKRGYGILTKKNRYIVIMPQRDFRLKSISCVEYVPIRVTFSPRNLHRFFFLDLSRQLFVGITATRYESFMETGNGYLMLESPFGGKREGKGRRAMTIFLFWGGKREGDFRQTRFFCVAYVSYMGSRGRDGS